MKALSSSPSTAEKRKPEYSNGGILVAVCVGRGELHTGSERLSELPEVAQRGQRSRARAKGQKGRVQFLSKLRAFAHAVASTYCVSLASGSCPPVPGCRATGPPLGVLVTVTPFPASCPLCIGLSLCCLVKYRRWGGWRAAPALGSSPCPLPVPGVSTQ
jgi:hypothetical protein